MTDSGNVTNLPGEFLQLRIGLLNVLLTTFQSSAIIKVNLSIDKKISLWWIQKIKDIATKMQPFSTKVWDCCKQTRVYPLFNIILSVDRKIELNTWKQLRSTISQVLVVTDKEVASLLVYGRCAFALMFNHCGVNVKNLNSAKCKNFWWTWKLILDIISDTLKFPSIICLEIIRIKNSHALNTKTYWWLI